MRREQTEYQQSQRCQQVARKPTLFSVAACEPGLWGDERYSHVLHEENAEENLFASLRHDATEYFARRNIPWQGDGSDSTLPTGNLCSSQVLCANTLFPFAHRPDQLVTLLTGLGFDARRALPIPNDSASSGPPDRVHFIGFEWHDGGENLLRERGGSTRPRGAYATSADFVVLLERTDGSRQFLLGEWKYTETYDATPKQFSERGTNRATIYEHALRSKWNPIHWGVRTIWRSRGPIFRPL